MISKMPRGNCDVICNDYEILATEKMLDVASEISISRDILIQRAST
jgi:hypothetical protein